MTERDTGSPPASSSPPDSIQIVETIAEHLETDPTELDFTFGEYVDPDALDRLLESNTDQIIVAFTIDDLLVTVANDGTIKVRDYPE